MQPILVLASYQPPPPDQAAAAPTAPEGDFLASFTSEALADDPAKEVADGPLAVLLGPVSPMLVAPLIGGTGAAELPGPAVGVDVALAVAAMSDAARMPDGGAGQALAPLQIAEFEPDALRPGSPGSEAEHPLPHGFAAEKGWAASQEVVAGLPAAGGDRSAEPGKDLRAPALPTAAPEPDPPVAASVASPPEPLRATLPGTGPSSLSSGLPRGQLRAEAMGDAVPAGAAVDAVSGAVVDAVAGADAAAAWTVPGDPATGSQPPAINAPAAPAPAADGLARPQDATAGTAKHEIRADLPAQDLSDSAASLPLAEVSDLADRKTLDRPLIDSQPGAGVWESMFSALALPASAAGWTAPSGQPVPVSAMLSVTAAEAVLTIPAALVPMTSAASRLIEIAQPTPDHPRTERGAPQDAAYPAATGPADVPQVTASRANAPQVAPAIALLARATPLVADVEAADRARADEMVPVYLSPGAASAGVMQTGATVASSPPLPSPVLPAAAQMVAALSQTADGATELALSPEELGRVRLRLEPDAANPDRMVVLITFERPETLDLFRRHAGELADALRAAGYAGADIGFGQDRGGSGGHDGPDRQAGGWAPGPDHPDPLSPLPHAPRLAAGASLDLRL